MKWSKDQSINLSRVCVAAFAVILFAADVCGVPLTRFFASFRNVGEYQGYFIATLYTLSLCGWICLWMLWQLLSHLKQEDIFTSGNVRLLRNVSWCCAAAAVISLVSAVYYLPFALLAIAAAFMMLIVRIVKNVFQRAAEMKSVLDLTI